MNLYGLIGYPLTHSFSKKYFTEKFTNSGLSDLVRYELFPLRNIEEFESLLKQYAPNLKGLNVTIPYKITVMPLLTYLDERAEKVGSVNTIAVLSDGTTKGYNTDIDGFQQSLSPLILANHSHALILGTGGAAKGVAYVLDKAGIDYTLVSRKLEAGQLSYQQLDRKIMEQHTLVINTTPLGMFPNIELYPDIPYQHVGNRHFFYDLVYNPAQTLFLQKAAMQGASVKNGLEMLYLQAEQSWRIWCNPT